MKQVSWFKLEHYALKVVIFSCLFLFLFKLWFSKNPGLIAINTIVDSSVLFGLYLLLVLTDFLVFRHKKIKKTNHLKKAVNFVFYALFMVSFAMFFLNSVFLDNVAVMKYTLSGMSLGTTMFALTRIIHTRYLVAIPFCLILIFAVSRIKLQDYITIPKKSLKYAMIGILIFALAAAVSNYDLVSNAYVNTFHDIFLTKYVYEFQVNQTELFNADYSPETFNNNNIDYTTEIPEGKRVLIFMMEQVSYNVFLKDSAEIPDKQNFFRKTINHTHVYTNYYTSNQDSRTAIWTMFNSHFIPFESYIYNWNSEYGFVVEEKNMVEFFKSQGYHTHVASAVYEPGLIIGVYNWNSLTFLKSFDEKNPDFFCIHNFKYQKGCEDRIIIEDVKEVLKEHKEGNLFFFQEFIYGHGEEYQQNLKKTRTEYYNDYLLEIYNFLEQESMIEDTIIIVLSDHGDKGYEEKEIESYHIPFMIISSELEPRQINNLYSHLQFKDILLSYLGHPEAQQSSSVFFVGQTQSNEIGYITSEDNHFIANLHGDTVRIRSMSEMFTREDIQELVNQYFKYQTEVSEKSSEKHYYCVFCSQNMRTAELNRG